MLMRRTPLSRGEGLGERNLEAENWSGIARHSVDRGVLQCKHSSCDYRRMSSDRCSGTNMTYASRYARSKDFAYTVGL